MDFSTFIILISLIGIVGFTGIGLVVAYHQRNAHIADWGGYMAGGAIVVLFVITIIERFING